MQKLQNSALLQDYANAKHYTGVEIFCQSKKQQDVYLYLHQQSFLAKKVYNRDYGWTCLGFPVQCITNSVELPNQAKASTANGAIAASFLYCMPALMLHNVGARDQCCKNNAVIYCSTNIFEG